MTERRRPGRPRHEQPSAHYVAQREQLVQEAAHIFRIHGFDRGSLEEIAGLLGVTRANLYYYVKSKEELLYEVIDRTMTVAHDRLEAVRQIADPEERFRELLRRHIRLIAEEHSLFTVYFESRARMSAEHEAAIRQREQQYTGIFTEVVGAAMAAGALPQAHLPFAVHAILGMCNWTYKWFDPDGPRSIDQLCADIIGLVDRSTG